MAVFTRRGNVVFWEEQGDSFHVLPSVEAARGLVPEEVLGAASVALGGFDFVEELDI